MQIVLLEPFFTGSHAAWAQQLQAHSEHDVAILSMKGNFWKWRMHGGAVSLARQYLEKDLNPDLILATDMLDLTTFLSLTRKKTANIPVALYMHENQITYPWSPTDQDQKLKRDRHYGFINFTSVLAADHIYFNSTYHYQSFFEALPKFLKAFPDHQELETVNLIQARSKVLPLGLDLKKFDTHKLKNQSTTPLILWNHRWEYDKEPETFFQILFQLADEGFDFELAVLGQSYGKAPTIFKEAKQKLKGRILHWGYAKDFGVYTKWLWKADILPVTSIHDFFGVSVVEAIYCENYPLLPNRLAYPEHIPEKYHDAFLYKNDAELLDKLRKMLGHPLKEYPAILDLKNTVSGYDWLVMKDEYNIVLNSIFDTDLTDGTDI